MSMTKLWLVVPATLLAFGGAAAFAQPLSREPTLHTPEVIAPAVLPYLACLYAERGLPLLRGADGKQVSYDKSTSDCSGARAHATADARKLLQGKPTPDGASADDFIERTLTDMDAYVASLPKVAAGEEAQQAPVIGIPVTIEDEVQPAYARYDDCLKTQVGNSPVTPANVLGLFELAMTVCRSVRDLAVKQATDALVSKGWDEATRARAAETTFAKVDQSWLAMGRQYQQLLLARASPAVNRQRKKAR